MGAVDRESLLDETWPVSAEVRRRASLVKEWGAINEYGFDAFGFHPPTAMAAATVVEQLYRRYFRVEAQEVENVPAEGRVLLFGNHSGQLPIDGAMIAAAQLLDRDQPRIVRSLFEFWFPTLPFVGTFLNRAGQVTGLPENCRRLLDADQCLLVFPEGIRGSGKLYRDRYKLKRFGTGFVRLALQTGSPLVPVATAGGEEQAPSFHDLRPVARLLGFPYFPLTPFFPWLGPVGMLPLPVKYRIRFGKPIHLDGRGDEPDSVIHAHVERLRGELRTLLDALLAERKHVFW